MTQWQYRIGQLYDSDMNAMAVELNEEGKNGWELVAIYNNIFIMKRPDNSACLEVLKGYVDITTAKDHAAGRKVFLKRG